MKTLIMFQNKPVPVYFTTDSKQPVQKVLKLLTSALDNKIQTGKKALQNASTPSSALKSRDPRPFFTAKAKTILLRYLSFKEG